MPFDFVILSDSGCDLSPAVFADWGVAYGSLTFRFDDSEKEYGNGDMPAAEFYAKMRAGSVAKTAAINTETFAALFEPHLKAGKDILYIGFSSGLSNTYNAGRLAAEGLREQYPDRKIFTVDSLSASAGEALFLYHVLEKAKSGATIEETVAYAEEIRLSVCHWFTVDDLVYLKRGGRVSPATAIVGNMLGIKPVMHVDNEGHLIKVNTARGRRKSLAALAEMYKTTALDKDHGTVFISHGDCEADAKLLADMIAAEGNAKVSLITDVGPVIGAHSGPGTMALFFLGTQR